MNRDRLLIAKSELNITHHNELIKKMKESNDPIWGDNIKFHENAIVKEQEKINHIKHITSFSRNPY